jgi:hypothetical protein
MRVERKLDDENAYTLPDPHGQPAPNPTNRLRSKLIVLDRYPGAAERRQARKASLPSELRTALDELEQLLLERCAPIIAMQAMGALNTKQNNAAADERAVMALTVQDAALCVVELASAQIQSVERAARALRGRQGTASLCSLRLAHGLLARSTAPKLSLEA